ncbi:hypothetical protein SPBR_01945 [Sporothrix brasiliensis 5110]|uniref:Uncharacterized protein n=1 Tax=Sporothrix brasiliensis 5110 TaxID=1398154 RepID=A0A0C2J245_9PEZI|nr:uncharacterized protein SPBR_01945 [Sporothrix brasiliensis 5110]KIH91137.1 hypothetical protein SPBR_01945 [Sporothrix brasiliensis 5110]
MPALDNTSTPVPGIQYVGTKQVFQHLGAVPKSVDCVVVGGVTADDFCALEAARDRRGRRIRFFFQPEYSCLVITIPTGYHELGHGVLYEKVLFGLRDMGVDNQWESTLSKRFDGQGGSSGEGDSSGGPWPRASLHNGKTWPTLVVEAGASQSLSSLRVKGQWWFHASDFHMKIVLLVKIHQHDLSIHIEQWTASLSTSASGPRRSGATNTRAGGAAGSTTRQPEIKQQVSITWAGHLPFTSSPPHQYTEADFLVVGAPLVLRFQDLMDRPPVPSAGDHDVVISEHDLQNVAVRVWRQRE